MNTNVHRHTVAWEGLPSLGVQKRTCMLIRLDVRSPKISTL